MSTEPLVILIHGLGRTTASMALMAQRLGTAGFDTMRIGYPGTRLAMVEAEAHVRAQIPGGRPLALVGHSLGGILARRILTDPQGLEVRRVVQLGSPNRGSALIDRIGWAGPVKLACGPILAEINAMTPPAAPCALVGAIAGTAGWIVPGTGLTPPHDGAVSAQSAWTGARHRTSVPVLHSLLPVSTRATAHVITFLTHGHFTEERAP